MADTPTIERYAEPPYDQTTSEQQEAYRWLIETRARLPDPNKIYVQNPKLAKVMGRRNTGNGPMNAAAPRRSRQARPLHPVVLDNMAADLLQ